MPDFYELSNAALGYTPAVKPDGRLQGFDGATGSHALNKYLLACCAALCAHAAHAATAFERQADAPTAPHQRLASNRAPVTVHFVHLKDDYRDSPAQAAFLAELKQAVAICTEGRRRQGLPANPPTAFPDQVGHAHEFTYAAPNRSISYFIAYLAQMGEDCSLLETETATAQLRSSKGQCDIDLKRKTAAGVCDPGGHADAAPPRLPPRLPPSRAQYERSMAAQVAAIRQLTSGAATGPAAGERRTIAGFACEMMSGMPGIQSCISKAGSFVPAGTGGLGVTLYRALGKETSTAVEAKFDMPVDAAIFAPYAQGGFSIRQKGGK